MNNLERQELFAKVDEVITWKLEALRNRIWKEAQNVAEEDLEKFIEDLRISAVFCSDAGTYLELQAELGRILNKVENRRDMSAPMRSAEIMKKLGIR